MTDKEVSYLEKMFGLKKGSREKFRDETISKLEGNVEKYIHDFNGSRDNPELVKFSAQWYSENVDLPTLSHYMSNGYRPDNAINESIESAFTYYLPQIISEKKGYLSKKEISRIFEAEEWDNKFSLRGILRASQILGDVTYGLEIPRDFMYKNDEALHAIAGELINQRYDISPYLGNEEELEIESEKGRKNIRMDLNEEVCQKIPEVLRKYETLFGVSFPNETKVNERLVRTIYNFDNRFPNFWRKRSLQLNSREERDREFGVHVIFAK